MCGIAGMARAAGGGVREETLLRMARTIRHRGPDGYGVLASDRIGLAHTRLSVIDPGHGAQPMANEDGRIHVVFNGEIYNHVELRKTLEAAGHRFRTRCDTEVLVHGYEAWGADLVHRLNGQFAFAIHDGSTDTLFLARDRFGIRPLFYAHRDGVLVFGSEVKALLASGRVEAELDPTGLDEVFTFWAARPPRTVFRGVRSLEPGCYAFWSEGTLAVRRYYEFDFPTEKRDPVGAEEALDGILQSSVRLRMRADVPVGAYLSGGLDSSITAQLASEESPHRLRTFSLGFADEDLDESRFQAIVSRDIGSRHLARAIDADDVAGRFPDVIRHTETPVVRTAPTPLFHLSRATRENGIKVVLTGEGADEVMLGYDLFKETKVRLFCLRQPSSEWRPRLFDRLYPYLGEAARVGPFWRRFFLDAGPPDDPLFSHLPRFRMTSGIKEFYRSDFADALRGFDPLAELRGSLPRAFEGWEALDRAAYLELVTLLSPYLLSSQGDRMAMAHGVEGRFPFLDHRLFEFAAALPSTTRLPGLREKDLLKRWARGRVPDAVVDRHKQPYRSPDSPAFFGSGEPAYVTELLGPDAIRRTGIFEPDAVHGLLRRCRAGRITAFRENQALVGILSTQLWLQEFVESSWNVEPLPPGGADVRIQLGDRHLVSSAP